MIEKKCNNCRYFISNGYLLDGGGLCSSPLTPLIETNGNYTPLFAHYVAGNPMAGLYAQYYCFQQNTRHFSRSLNPELRIRENITITETFNNKR